MKAPDKIYVTIDRPAEKVLYNPELVGVAWSKKDKSCEHIEYIRKDSLLKWANEHKQAICINGNEESAYDRGQYSVILALIDKLQSL